MIFSIEKVADGVNYDIRVQLDETGTFFVSDVGLKPKGKRVFRYTCGRLRTIHSKEDKKVMMAQLVMEVCPIDLLNEALEEAWLQLKPTKLERLSEE